MRGWALSGARSLGLIGLVALGISGYSLLVLGLYGFTLFVILPILLGCLASWVVQPTTALRASAVGAVAVAAGITAFVGAGLEGFICAIMSMPLSIPMGAVGGWLVFRRRTSGLALPNVAMILLLPPASLVWDVTAPPPVFEVRSSIEVGAAPEQVWPHVVAFPDLPGPHEWYFRAGLAYPIRARIEGVGPGAIRLCQFSTGSFVEPIEIWNEPSLLRFRVASSPAPMHEWSPWGDVHPKHLEGYMVSKQGQFQLTRLPGNRTLLQGTTWYQHGLWPAAYWRWWSDAIIHRIHLRVLTHIRTLAEQETSAR